VTVRQVRPAGRRNAVAEMTQGVAQNLVVPHGFTLIIGATLAILIGERGYPGALGICVFVVGANAALLLWVGLLGGHRHPAVAPASGLGVFNVAPTLTVPLVFGLTRAIHPPDAAFLCAGVLAVTCYVFLVGSLATVAVRWDTR
jgi:hypothetical protein